MARIHSKKRGKSGSNRPGRKKKASWVSYDASEIEQLVLKLFKQANSPSKIGLILRDNYGIPDVKSVLHKSILKVLKDNDLKEKLPEDLTALIRRVITIMKHLETHKKDEPGKRGLILTESKIRRLSKYYKREGILDEGWKYSRGEAKLLVG